jgi:hypothetical protein
MRGRAPRRDGTSGFGPSWNCHLKPLIKASLLSYGWLSKASVMRIARTNFDRQESRRDRRYALPTLTIAIAGEDYPSDNWSLGGFQLTAPLALAVGDVVSGTLRLEGSEALAFTASVVRRDDPAGAFGFRFQELSPPAVTMLDRALARRLARRRP